ncbi:MAG: segregation/condensation protein A [Cocleimonas sp.]|nr:segregation/condensation protein A [Cocleimonas sp.]
MNQIDLQTQPSQDEQPFAIVQGEPLTTLPEDLYIPPDALEVFLETFEGPLDLLLYLIRRQNLDILNIPIAEITRQYMDYVELMRTVNLDLAAEYLVMAALLAEIKSRMLLPRSEEVEDEDDPRAELVRRLQEYERFKQAATDISELPRQERDYFPSEVKPIRKEKQQVHPSIDLKDIVLAFQDILKRVDLKTSHQIQRESLSVRERMSQVLAKLNGDEFIEFHALFTLKEGRLGVVVSFLAILELLKSQLIDMIQAEAFAPLYIKAVTAEIEA